MTIKDYYGILQIPCSANSDEIRTAYRKLSLIYHPDKNIGIDTTFKMVEINEAYEVLKDEYKRKVYDMSYARYFGKGIINITHETNKKEYNETDLNDIINDAHKKAKDIVSELLKEIKATSKDAINGFIDSFIPYIVGGIIVTILILLIRHLS